MGGYNGAGVIRMRKFSKEIIQSAVVGFLIPAVLLVGVMAVSAQPEQLQPTQTGTPVTLPQTTTMPPKAPSTLYIPVLQGEDTVNLDLEEYLVGVLLAEVPAAFETEALKAQAVAARTYALKCHYQGYKHKGAICTQASCCQGYLPPEAYLHKGGEQAGVDKIRSAVQETAGQVLVHEGELILATYFDCSGGSTEDAAAVWGTTYPYLQAVESPGEEYAAHYSDRKIFTAESLQAALGVALEGEPGTWFGAVTYTPGSGVETMEIGGVSYRGTTLRTLLGLRSTIFAVSVANGEITFSTQGYGHRVGLSQYGADAMAMAGSSYTEILTHYYQDVQIILYEFEG